MSKFRQFLSHCLSAGSPLLFTDKIILIYLSPLCCRGDSDLNLCLMPGVIAKICNLFRGRAIHIKLQRSSLYLPTYLPTQVGTLSVRHLKDKNVYKFDFYISLDLRSNSVKFRDEYIREARLPFSKQKRGRVWRIFN